MAPPSSSLVLCSNVTSSVKPALAPPPPPPPPVENSNLLKLPHPFSVSLITKGPYHGSLIWFVIRLPH